MTYREGKSGIIELKATQDDSADPGDACDAPEIVKLMIKYFYHLDYLHNTESRQAYLNSNGKKGESVSQDGSNVFMIEHAKVFAMAVKYQVDGLRDLAISKFQAQVKSHWNHQDFPHTIFVVYNSTPQDVTQLRDLVANQMHETFEELQNKPEIEEVVLSIPKLSYNLLKRSRPEITCKMGHETIELATISCKGCKYEFRGCRSCCTEGHGMQCKHCERTYTYRTCGY